MIEEMHEQQGVVSFLCFAFALHFSMFIPLLIRSDT